VCSLEDEDEHVAFVKLYSKKERYIILLFNDPEISMTPRLSQLVVPISFVLK
jgi:hypothetical protein